MISIVTAYYNRKKLFINTLNSIVNQNFTGNFEVIAVDDGSDENERLEDLQEIYPFLRVIYLEPSKKWYKNSCIPFNIGFAAAKGDKIIIQNPECLHVDNILNYTEKNLVKNKYISFACFSLDKTNTEIVEEIISDRNKLKNIMEQNNFRFKMDGELGWYNHSEHHPVFYHFCCCITKEDLYDLGGFDERYALGIGVDDNEFIYRIKQKGIVMKIEDNLSVLHQNHYNHLINADKIFAQKSIDYKRNFELFENVTKSSKLWKANYLGPSVNLEPSTIAEDYQNEINKTIVEIIQYRFSRKIALILLNFLKTIKY
ncbi:glycosyltransferase [Kaistella sp. G5-32]|uniref:Glycosyltransferase n=1 Tax=Kaistella gelatinilytica TaxID=2787636 RepID=A0ABS0FC42_9FLAO|nr:glycosyltransferase [Kaistella gelatinilytica]MBF8457266.1 glycosyltransferase [Kaistella gelatinilytica]